MASAETRIPAPPPAPAGGPPVEPEIEARARRRVRNFLIDTGLQLRLASYLVAVAVALSIGLGVLLWRAYRETSRVVELSDPEVGATIAALLAEEDRLRMVLVAGALVVVLVCLLGAAVVVTHRIAGPAYAIGRTCRRVAEGDLAEPRPLRAGDLLLDLGDDVAAMVRVLREREAADAVLLRRAAEALRASGASPLAADVAAAADEKERRARS